MAIVGHRVTGFFLPGRFDVHLLPGDASPDLFGGSSSNSVEIHDDRDPVTVSVRAEAGNHPAGCGWHRTARATAASSPASAEAESAYTMPSASRSIPTRVVTVDNPLPPGTRIQNFLVKAIATARNGAERTSVEAWVRVHVHERVERIWLTPNVMTLHPGSERQPRFALFGGVRRRHRHRHHAERRADTHLGRTRHVDERPRPERPRRDRHREPEIRFDPRASSRERPYHRVVPAAGRRAPITDTATVRIVQPWNEGVNLTLLSGDASRRRHVPNILFICEGFEDSAADRHAFNRIVNVVVEGLRRNHIIDPWPMSSRLGQLLERVHARPPTGATHRSEVYTKDANAQNTPFFDVPQPEAPKATT